MRVQVGKTVRVKAADRVEISCRLPSGLSYARLSVWSAVEGYEFSPHVQNSQIETVNKDGKPNFLSPMALRLTEEQTPSKVIEFTADYDMLFRVMQEKDIESDTSALIRIRHHGQAYVALRQRCRNFFRAIRSYSQKAIGLHP